MIKVSDEYKVAMSNYLRENAYTIVTIGVVESGTQEAVTTDGEVDDEYTWWSNLTAPLGHSVADQKIDYATYEQDFVLCDGSMKFLPDESDFETTDGYCIISSEIMGSIKFVFDGTFDIKGLNIDFTDYYPTEFTVETDELTTTFTNDSRVFNTSEVIGDGTSYMIITPTSMVGGEQRLRIASITMGAGLILTNTEISSASIVKDCSAISEELSSTTLTVDVIDYDDNYNYDNPDSFINYLQSGQNVNIKMGQTLDDNTVEYVEVANLWLSGWSSAYGKMTFTANDKLAFWNETTYSTDTSGTIHTRTIYDDCIDILTDMELDSSEYVVDEYLQNITIINPLPEASHSELLQMLANAGRSILYQDNLGRIVIKTNFPYDILENGMTLSTETNADWGSLDHILDDSVTVYYSDFTSDFSIVDGTMYVLPEDSSDYLDGTSYVSSDVADDDGYFTTNPQIACDLETSFGWSSLIINFAGNPPQEIVCHTSWQGTDNDDVTFTDLELENELVGQFGIFDSIEIEVTQGSPNSRVLITYLSLGIGNEYTLEKDDMLENVLGSTDETVKEVKVRVITYEEETDDDGNVSASQVDDEVYYTLTLNDTGTTATYENQLIHTEEMAEDVAYWLGNYYKNMLDYDVDYRGEPKLEAGDYIRVESDYNDALITQIERAELDFSGAYSGNLTLRRAIKEL